MKNYIFIIIISFTSLGYSQNVLILDSTTKKPVENASLFCSKKNIGTTSKKNGVVNLELFNINDTIRISHVNYFEKIMVVKDVKEKIFIQTKTTLLPTIVFHEKKKHLVNSFESVSLQEIGERSAEYNSISEALSNTSPVVIQESQAGGGSPNFRGMEANRLLIVVDDVSLNNTIYRSGHVQSSSIINPFFIKNFNIVTASGSAAYGNGAMGSAIVFNTISPKLNSEPRNHINQKFESSSNSSSLNYKTNYGNSRFAYITAFSIKSAENLKMGNNRGHGYTDWGKYDFVTIENEQLNTEHNKYDILNKLLISLNKKQKIYLNTQFSTTSNINRFDKLNDTENGLQKYTTWHYGPQKRFFQSLSLKTISYSALFDYSDVLLGFQKIKESRHKKKNSDFFLSNRQEKLNVFDLNINLSKKLNKIKVNYGFGGRRQNLKSIANKQDSLNNYFYNSTRYPSGGSFVNDVFMYSQVEFSFSKSMQLYIGGRYNYNLLRAMFDDTITYSFPFKKIENLNRSASYNMSLNFKINENTMLDLSYYTGFRNPNIDDVGKVFSKNNQHVVIPNERLNPEKSNNIELGIKTTITKNIKLDFQLFNTVINDAIVRRNAHLNLDTTMLYDGEVMRIQMNQNVESANIYGFNCMSQIVLNSFFSIKTNCNYLIGKDSENNPLAHIPPFNATFSLKYKHSNNSIDFYWLYNSSKKAECFDFAGIDNLDEATPNGIPSWYTLNLFYSKKIQEDLFVSCGIKNILDAHYKTFGSGISASGRNFTLSLHSYF